MFKLCKIDKNSEQTYWDMAASVYRSSGVRASGDTGYIALRATPQLTRPYYHPQMHTAYFYAHKPQAAGLRVFHTSELV